MWNLTPSHRTVWFVVAQLVVMTSTLVEGQMISEELSAAIQEQRANEHRVIILLREDLRELNASSAGKVSISSRLGIEQIDSHWSFIPAFAATVDADTLIELSHNPLITSIEPDRGGALLDLESQSLIRAAEAHRVGLDGLGQTVAVIDTGVNSRHPDLLDAVLAEGCWCRDSKGKGCCPNGSSSQFGPGAARDDYGHGTTVAAVIGSRGVVGPRGIAPRSGIIAARVFDSTGNMAWTSQVLSAFEWILTTRPDVRVINMSFQLGPLQAGPCDASNRAMSEAVRIARERGVVVVSASGNDGSVTSMRPPACIEDVLSVGSVYDANIGWHRTPACWDTSTAADQFSCFSNTDATLDLVAPGALITGAGARGGVVATSGTSLASPHVAAAAALLLQAYPSMAPEEIERKLRLTGFPLIDPRTGRTVPRLDIATAVRPEVPAGPRRRSVSRAHSVVGSPAASMSPTSGAAHSIGCESSDGD